MRSLSLCGRVGRIKNNILFGAIINSNILKSIQTILNKQRKKSKKLKISPIRVRPNLNKKSNQRKILLRKRKCKNQNSNLLLIIPKNNHMCLFIAFEESLLSEFMTNCSPSLRNNFRNNFGIRKLKNIKYLVTQNLLSLPYGPTKNYLCTHLRL